MSAEFVQPFREAVASGTEQLREEAVRGRKVIGYFCTYTPVEVIHAAGFLPVRILGGDGRIDRALALVPNFICPPLLRSLDRALEGGYDFLSGIVQGYTCDVACGLVNVWEENIGGQIFHSIPLPYGDGPEARHYFRSLMDELQDKLVDLGGVITEESLGASLDLYGSIRSLMLDFYGRRYDGKLPLTAGEFHQVIQAGLVIPPERYLTMLTDLSHRIDTPAPVQTPSGIPLMISGSIIEEPRVLEILEEAGGRVAADDLCTGLRNFHPPVGAGGDAMARLIDRYQKRFPCPSRARAGQRAPLMIEIIRRAKARGVVFFLQKFCSPHLADIPFLKEALRKEGIPALVVEMEATGMMEGQLQTRLQGFLEMLRS
jgi:benzoyl-CoA reductase/2-hydroxyglutaryl-CoA dehydratase subunit BcrC/BadD/HgdB